MHADEVSTAFGQALMNAGFKGILPANKAREIVEQVTAKFAGYKFRITVDMSPIHYVGKPTGVNCARSTVKVEPLHPVPKNR